MRLNRKWVAIKRRLPIEVVWVIGKRKEFLNVFNWVLHNRFNRMLKQPCSPVFCSVAVTWKCPSRCATCGIWNSPILPKEEMNVLDYEGILKDPLIKQTNCWEMTGGEPFMYRDIIDLTYLAFEHLKKAQIRIGTDCILEEKVIECVDHFKKKPLYLSLSIDGIGEVHDQIRGVKGNFQNVMNVIHHIRDLQKNGSPVDFGASVCVSQLNLDHIPQLTEWLEKEKIPFQLTPVVFPPYAQIKYARKPRCDLDFYGEYAQAAAELFGKYSKETYDVFRRFWLGEPYKIAPCYALIKYVHICPNGNVEVCMWNPIVIGNLRNQTFSEIWKGRTAKRTRKLIHHCRACGKVHPNMCDALNNYYFHGYQHFDALHNQLRSVKKQ